MIDLGTEILQMIHCAMVFLNQPYSFLCGDLMDSWMLCDQADYSNDIQCSWLFSRCFHLSQEAQILDWEKKKKNCIKVLSSLYRPLFILSQTSVQSTKVTKRSPMQPFNNKKKRNGPVTWGALHLSSIRSLWNLSIIKRVDNINWPL